MLVCSLQTFTCIKTDATKSEGTGVLEIQLADFRIKDKEAENKTCPCLFQLTLLSDEQAKKKMSSFIHADISNALFHGPNPNSSPQH